MNVEFIADGAQECPLIRLFGLDLRAFVELRETTRFLGDHENRSVDLGKQANFALRNLDALVLKNSGPRGVELEGREATWTLNRPDWHVVSLLIKPFIDEPSAGESYQWLTGPESIDALWMEGISILLSHSAEGTW